jgi:flagellar L-ring protein precursor FlgH
MRFTLLFLTLSLCVAPAFAASGAKKKDPAPSDLEKYVADVNRNVRQAATSTPGSIYLGGGRLAEGLRDLRASQTYDLVYIVVSDRASAVSKGATNTDRKSSAKASVTSLLAPIKATAALANLANMSGETQLQGQGTTSRDNVLTTTLTAEVLNVLPNGNLVVQGQKEIVVNSERQVVTVRGIVRPDDLSPSNSITSDRLARLEVHVNGKGVVEDAVKRPFILYRLLLGLLPF